MRGRGGAEVGEQTSLPPSRLGTLDAPPPRAPLEGGREGGAKTQHSWTPHQPDGWMHRQRSPGVQRSPGGERPPKEDLLGAGTTTPFPLAPRGPFSLHGPRTTGAGHTAPRQAREGGRQRGFQQVCVHARTGPRTPLVEEEEEEASGPGSHAEQGEETPQGHPGHTRTPLLLGGSESHTPPGRGSSQLLQTPHEGDSSTTLRGSRRFCFRGTSFPVIGIHRLLAPLTVSVRFRGWQVRTPTGAPPALSLIPRQFLPQTSIPRPLLPSCGPMEYCSFIIP